MPYDDHYGSESTSERRFEKKMYFSSMIRIRFTRLYIELQLAYKRRRKQLYGETIAKKSGTEKFK